LNPRWRLKLNLISYGKNSGIAGSGSAFNTDYNLLR
jgi:hypothetical protein